MPRRAFAAVLTAAALLLHASAQANGTPDDAFSLELKEVAAGLEQWGLSIDGYYSGSELKVCWLFLEIADELVAYDDQLRALNHPPEKRMPMLRKRFRKLAKQIDQLEPDVSFDEETGVTKINHLDGSSTEFPHLFNFYLVFDMKAALERERLMRQNMLRVFWAVAALALLALLFFLVRKERARLDDAS